jgi:general secretion pathway protein G
MVTTRIYQTLATLFQFGRRCAPPGKPQLLTRQLGDDPPPESRDAGFTILEILVVVTIIGLLIGLVAPAALRQLGGARVSVAKQSIERLGTVLDLYNLDMGSYPTTEQGLTALVKKPSAAANWNGPYLKGDAVPLDPWNHPFIYRNPSERPGHDYDLCSNGANADAAQKDVLCNL